MGLTQRVLLAIGIVAIDLVAFFVPLTAMVLAYVIVFNPTWFRNFILNLDG
jgi:hypothetical protein